MKARPFLIKTFLSVALITLIPNIFCYSQNACSYDSLMTTKLYVSTGIGCNNLSDTAVLKGGYGGNSAYPTPNNNVDTFWTISKLSSNYNPRITGSFPVYTGSYLTVGANPFVIADTNSPVYSYWGIFAAGGNCVATPSSPANWVTNWLSVYTDAGGQNGNINNAVNDGYAYDRCFFVCSNDSLTFKLILLADDIIDTVKVDNTNLYVTSNNLSSSNFYCPKLISINVKKYMTSGRHVLRICQRDNAGGHLGINVYGTISSSGSTKTILRSKYDSKCTGNHIFTEVPAIYTQKYEVNVSPNPNNGSFNIHLSDATHETLMKVSDMNGRLVAEQFIKVGDNPINLNVASGIYLLKICNENDVIVRKIVLEK